MSEQLTLWDIPSATSSPESADGATHCDSPDGLIDDDGVLEIKCVIAPVHEATIQRGKFDPAYKWQIVGHLDGSGRDWVDFASFCSDYPEHQRLVIYRTWREEMENELAELAERRAQFLEMVRAKTEQLQQKEAA